MADPAHSLVVNGSQLKLFLWYGNEWGYTNRCAELVYKMSAKSANKQLIASNTKAKL